VSCSKEEIQREENLPALLSLAFPVARDVLQPIGREELPRTREERESCFSLRSLVLFRRFVTLVPLRRKGPTTHDDGSWFSLSKKGKCVVVVLSTHADRGRSGSFFSSSNFFPSRHVEGNFFYDFRSFELVTCE